MISAVIAASVALALVTVNPHVPDNKKQDDVLKIEIPEEHETSPAKEGTNKGEKEAKK